MAGGCDGWCGDSQSKALSSAEVYNPDTDEWILIAPLPVPLHRWFIVIYLFGFYSILALKSSCDELMADAKLTYSYFIGPSFFGLQNTPDRGQ